MSLLQLLTGPVVTVPSPLTYPVSLRVDTPLVNLGYPEEPSKKLLPRPEGRWVGTTLQMTTCPGPERAGWGWVCRGAGSALREALALKPVGHPLAPPS